MARSVQRSQTYRVMSASNDEYLVELPPGSTVAQMKAEVSRRLGLPPGSLLLFFGADELADNSSLEAAHVMAGTVIRLELRQTSLPPSTVPVTVQLPSGRTVTVSVPENAGEQVIKQELQKKEPQLNFSSISLTLNHEPLSPDIRAQELRDEMLHAISQLRGGK